MFDPHPNLADCIKRWHAAHPDFEGTLLLQPSYCVEPDMTSRERRWRDAAAQIGTTTEEYARRRDAGERWCTGHRKWHSASAFYSSATRVTRCREAHKAYVAQKRRERIILGLQPQRRAS